MSGRGGPLTQITLTRPPDRWPDEDVLQLSGKFTGLYFGNTWFVHHALASTDLIIDVWLDSSTPNARYTSAAQATDKDIIIQWDSTARGKVVVWSIGADQQDAMIHLQTVDDDEWEIPHQFGTDNLICDVWVNGQRMDPTLITLDMFRVLVRFDAPCQGKVCIMVADPTRNRELKVSYYNLMDIPPEGFPPAPHEHPESGTVHLAEDSVRLGGILSHFWINIEDVGDIVCELDENGRIPLKRMPLTSNIMAGDYDQEVSAQRILVDSNLTPLFAKKQETDGITTVIVSSHPVVRFLQLVGEPGTVELLPSSQDNRIRTSANWDMRVITGSGIHFKKVDNNSFQISSTTVPPSVFQRSAPLFNGQSWHINSPVFAQPGRQFINAYEFRAVGAVASSESKHILGQWALNLVFNHQGDNILDLVGDRLQSRINMAADHFFWDEQMYDSLSGAVLLPMEFIVNAGYDEDFLDDFWVMFKNTNVGFWTFFRLNIRTGVMQQISSIPIDPDMPLLDIRHGHLYGLRGALTGVIELVRVPLTQVPTMMIWNTIATFSGISYPPDVNRGRLFRFHQWKLYLFEEGFNRLTVYDCLVPTAAASFIKIPPVQCTAFDLWPDGFLSFVHANPDFPGCFTSDMPASNPAHSYRHNIELLTGNSKFVGIGRLTGGTGLGEGLAIKSDGRWVVANEMHVESKVIYNTGEATYWLRTPFRWTVPFQYVRVFDINWESLELSAFADVRVGFIRTPATDAMPATLEGWTGTGWYTFPSSELAMQGATLDSIQTMELAGSDIVGYALYVRKTDPFTAGHIVNNFIFNYQLSSVVSPIPMSYNGEHGSLKVSIYPNLMVVENTQVRDIQQLTIVVDPI